MHPTPSWKGHPLFLTNPPSKNEGPVKPSLFENLVGGSIPPKQKEGVHTMNSES